LIFPRRGDYYVSFQIRTEMKVCWKTFLKGGTRR
jgi:hypothetical protein